MNKTTLIASAAVVAGATAVKTMTEWKKLIDDLEGRFPNTDRKSLSKAYRKFLMDSSLGRFDTDGLSDEQMDSLFEDYLNRTTY